MMEYFEFIETPTFVRQREGLLDDDTFQQLQEHLIRQHVMGDTIRNTGGCQKIRWNRPGSGTWRRAGYLLRSDCQRSALSADDLRKKRQR